MAHFNIKEVVLIGGSTKIPLLKKEITKIFAGRKPVSYINPAEVIAIGAAK